MLLPPTTVIFLLGGREYPNQLGSQIQGSTTPLSLPSEPPDVRNWFLSYEYESPVLGTTDGFKDPVTRDSGCFVSKESTEETENHLIISEILDSSCLPSQVSEPAGIGNWFSSYAYESFVLDTNDDVQDSVSEGSECEKGGSLVGERHNGQENMAATREIDVKSDSSLGDDEPDEKSSIKHSCKSQLQRAKFLISNTLMLIQILDSPDPSTVFTEPPDVKNWFSSYAYESPVLGTSDQFEDSLHLEMEPEKFVVEDSDLETEEKLTIIRKVRSGDEKVDEEKEHYNFTRHNSSIEVREQKQRIDRIGGKRSSSSQNKIHSDKTFKDILEEACSVSWNLNGISSSKKDKPQTNSFHTTDFKEKFMEEVSPLSPTSNSKLAQDCGASPRKQTHRRNDKENYQKGIAENGFVATRKNGSTRTANADSLKMSQGILLECSRNNRSVSPAGEKVVDRRKALIETTNYQNSDALEVTGKWRCPQKGKPSLGPPLKQLRLERWIHRV
ncbi:ATP-dependent caseinolytic protease/crotonase family protein [Citrus sinensis]|nr:ATP-dependent caseinolytic protease/crotonase family protein [Citrus sinensis]